MIKKLSVLSYFKTLNTFANNSYKGLFCQQKQKGNIPKPSSVDLLPKDFSQIDIRIGEILKCEKHTSSDNLYCESIKILTKPETIFQVASGLQKYVPLQNMKGKVIVMANLKPRKMAGFQSQGMVICATSEDKTKCQIIVPDGQVGERIYLQNYEGLYPYTQKIIQNLNPKKKILQKCLQFFRTDQQGYVIWKGIKLRTKNGYLKSNLKNAHVY